MVAALLSKAQLTIDANYNWQQLIPTILGGSCVQVSNVTFNSNQNASARFVTQNGFLGINGGLLITTGKAIDATGPNDTPSKGDDLSQQGDNTLTSLSGNQTYDAVILEFDFMSAEDDTVYIRYVFASEEYPEFVNSQYNDVFGFFVSGPGISGQQNIALIPGTNTPVAINNVNQFAFNQFYVDNTDSVECQYDGYTTPFIATFIAQAGQTYHLKIAIADAGDGIYDSGVFLESYPGIWGNLTGTVSHQGQPATAGDVELFGFNIDSTAANLVDITPINSSGYYNFQNVPSGAYIVRGTLDQNIYPGTFPKYYNDAILWEDADIIAFPCDTYTVDMGLMVVNTGDNQIEGALFYTNDYLKLATDTNFPVPNVNIFLLDENGVVYGYDKTDDLGKYSFVNINDGSYHIAVDIPGMKQFETHQVTVIDKQIVTGADYFVNDGIFIEDHVPVYENNGLAAFPNPASDNILIKFQAKEDTDITINVYDISGRQVASLYSGPVVKGNNYLPCGVSGVSSGVYFIRTTTGDEKHLTKLLITSN